MLDAYLDRLRTDPQLTGQVVTWKVDPARPGSYVSFDAGAAGAAPGLVQLLRERGVDQLYIHQGAAFEAIRNGQHAVIVTPTASGKSLCYNLPILSAIADERSGLRPSALYLFPTKALSQDQVSEVNSLVAGLGSTSSPIGAYTYDGDTPPDRRRALRESGDIVVTNPYMLHAGILPNHMRWGGFLRRLRFVVIDELHVYRGVMGSSVANVLRRLKRLARHYGSKPTFVACSATTRDPVGHFERLVEEKPVLIDRSGAPRAERHHVFYNPPVVNPALGLRSRAVDQVRMLAGHLMRASVPTIVFGRSRNTVEVLTKYLKDMAPQAGLHENQVVGYRGGYLPGLRRRIETGLRDGEIRTVVATNALELGVDIGSLEAVLMAGYPGSVSSYHQQSGRAGRRSGKSLSMLIATSMPLDQYIMQDSGCVLDGRSEKVVINPDNLVIAANHMKCAAFELPFSRAGNYERFAHGREMLDALSEPGGPLLRREDGYHWMSESYPAGNVSLDAAEADSFLVLDVEKKSSLGHVDRPAAITTIHPNAIYQHQGRQYQVVELDWTGRRAYARRVEVDYYTEAEVVTAIKVLQEDGSTSDELSEQGHGDVHVSVRPTLFKKIRFYTNENLETGPITLPAEEMGTSAMWVVFNPSLQKSVRFSESTRAGAVGGLAHLLRGVAPLFVRMAGAALKAKGFGSHPHFGRPAVILYDNVPGGVGLAEQLHRDRQQLFAAALGTLRSCPCRLGCPACIGIAGDRGPAAKAAAQEILTALTRNAFPGGSQPSVRQVLSGALPE